jgi:hypothetical protein
VAASCQPATQIEVLVNADTPACDAVRQRGIELHVGKTMTAAEEPNADASKEDRCAEDGGVGNLFLIPSGGGSGPVAIRVVLGVTRPTSECAPPWYDGCIVARRRLSYRPRTSLRLPILLSSACLDVPCDEESTCDPLRVACVSSEARVADDGLSEIPADAALLDVPRPRDGPTDTVVLDGPAMDAPTDADFDAGLNGDGGDGDAVPDATKDGLNVETDL